MLKCNQEAEQRDVSRRLREDEDETTMLTAFLKLVFSIILIMLVLVFLFTLFQQFQCLFNIYSNPTNPFVKQIKQRLTEIINCLLESGT